MHMGDDGLECETHDEEAAASAPSPRAIQAQNKTQTPEGIPPNQQDSKNKTQSPEGIPPNQQDSATGTDVTTSGAKHKHSSTRSRSAVADVNKSAKSPTPPPRKKQVRSTRAQDAIERRKKAESSELPKR